MEFTGERYVPEVHGNIELEHLHRYLLASQFCAEKNVLDIACGEGYGSSLLANYAFSVVGIDISENAINHARTKYDKKNLKFIVGDCVQIPLPDKSIDFVVSFETIEHIENHEQMMAEVVRVLKPTGLVLISSPDKLSYTLESGIKNPFHAKELLEQEFKDLLSTYFKRTIFWGQRVVYGSTILAENTQSNLTSYLLQNGEVNSKSGLVKPLYWIALASNDNLPEIVSGILECPIDDSEVVTSWEKIVAERELTIRTQEKRINELEEACRRRNHGTKSNCLENSTFIQKFSQKIIHSKIFRVKIGSLTILRDYFWIRNSRLFDAAYYLKANPDVQANQIDPLWHYVSYGWKEGRNPSPFFNAAYYLENNPGISALKSNAFVHFIMYGQKKGFKPSKNYSGELKHDRVP